MRCPSNALLSRHIPSIVGVGGSEWCCKFGQRWASGSAVNRDGLRSACRWTWLRRVGRSPRKRFITISKVHCSVIDMSHPEMKCLPERALTGALITARDQLVVVGAKPDDGQTSSKTRRDCFA